MDPAYDALVDKKSRHSLATPCALINLHTVIIILGAILFTLINLGIHLWLPAAVPHTTFYGKDEQPNNELQPKYDEYGVFFQCPDSAEEARAAGCSFDLLQGNGWIPPSCFNAEMHQFYVSGRDHDFFYDENATLKVSTGLIEQGDVSMFPDGLWVNWDEHMLHCRYLVNGSISALWDPTRDFLDVWLDERHMLHCLDMQGQESGQGTEKVLLGHPRCYSRHHLTGVPVSRTKCRVKGDIYPPICHEEGRPYMYPL